MNPTLFQPKIHLDQVTFPSVLIIDESVAVLPVDVTQHPTLPHPGYIAQHLRLCQQNNVCFIIHIVRINF